MRNRIALNSVQNNNISWTIFRETRRNTDNTNYIKASKIETFHPVESRYGRAVVKRLHGSTARYTDRRADRASWKCNIKSIALTTTSKCQTCWPINAIKLLCNIFDLSVYCLNPNLVSDIELSIIPIMQNPSWAGWSFCTVSIILAHLILESRAISLFRNTNHFVCFFVLRKPLSSNELSYRCQQIISVTFESLTNNILLLFEQPLSYGLICWLTW